MIRQDIEEIILAESLASQAIAREACDLLTVEDFSGSKQNNVIFDAIKTVLDSEYGLNRASLASEMSKRTIDSSRLAVLLAKHESSPTTESEIRFFIGFLRELNEREKLSRFARDLSIMADDDSIDLVAIREKMSNAVDFITPISLRTGNSISVIGDDFRRNIDRPSNTVLTGLYELDKASNGFPKKEMSVICAPGGAGKTSLALAIAYNAAKMGIPVAYYCFEMASEKMYEKVLSSHGGIPYFILERRPPQEIDRWKSTIAAASAELDDLPLFIFDETVTPELSRLIESIRFRAKKNGVQLIIVDYLQIVPVEGTDGEYEAITKVSSALRSVAKSADVAILALSQPNNNYDKRDPNRLPRLYDLHGSGQIGKDAANVYFIMRRQYGKEYVEAAAKNRFMVPFHETKLYYLKGRFGETPQMLGGLAYIPMYSKYVNAFWEEGKAEASPCPDCGAGRVLYCKGRITCSNCHMDQPAIDKQAKAGMVFKTQEGNVYGKDARYDFAFLKKGNFQSDHIIREITKLNHSIHTEDQEPIRRLSLHSGEEMEPIIIGAYMSEDANVQPF